MHRDFRNPDCNDSKTLLRHKRCVSNIEDFTKKNSFHRILEDHAYLKNNNLIELKKDKKIKKVIICSGKIYFDLLEVREKYKNSEIVFIRIEQLYPFPAKTLAKLLKRYSNAKIFGSRINHKIWVLGTP